MGGRELKVPLPAATVRVHPNNTSLLLEICAFHPRRSDFGTLYLVPWQARADNTEELDNVDLQMQELNQGVVEA